MSTEAKKDLATWTYRSIIGVLVSITLVFAKSNYDDFRAIQGIVYRHETKIEVHESRLGVLSDRMNLLTQLNSK